MTPTRLLLAAMALLIALPAAAQPRAKGPPKTWDISLGGGASWRPTFEGSDRSRFRPVPVITVNWRDTITFGEGGLSAQLRRGGFRAGGGLTFDGGRKDHDTGGVFGGGDDRLRGMGDIDFTLGLRGFAGYRLGFLELNASAVKYLGAQNDGVLASLGASAPLPLGKKLIFIPGIRASWADDKYMQTFFGVTPLQASRSIFRAFNARAGLQEVRGSANLIYRFDSHWYMAVNANVTRLMGDAATSPISIVDTNSSVTTLLGYRF
ncbi:MAG: MipA/OmpV family protein [Pseudomonadota bacterium]